LSAEDRKPNGAEPPGGGENPVHSTHWSEIALITLIGTLVVGGYTLGSLNRDAFFLMKFDVERLPLMLIVVALVSIPFLSIYGKVSSLFPTGGLASFYFLFVGLGYFLMSRLVLYDTQWSVLVFYLYVTLAGVLSISIFWLAVGARFFMRQAKKMMGIFGAGCVMGNLLGGAIGSLGADYVAVETLIEIVGGMFLLATLLSLWVFRSSQMAPNPEVEKKAGFAQGFKELSSTPLLRNIAMMLMAGVMLGTLADYQLQAIAEETYSSKVELVKFFGGLYAILGAVTLVAQLLFTNLVLKKFGMLGGLMSLPIAALPGAIMLLFFPSIASAIGLRGAETGVRFSTYSSGYELAYLPVQEAVRKRTKPLIDVLLKRGATGLAAGLILVLAEIQDSNRFAVSVATCVVVVVLAFLVWNVRKAYVAALQTNLSENEDGPFEQNMQTMVVSVPQTLLNHEQTGAWSTSILFAPDLQEQLQENDGASAFSQTSGQTPPGLAVPQILDNGTLFQRLLDKTDLRNTLRQLYERNDPRMATALVPILAIPEYKPMAEKIFRQYGDRVSGTLADAAFDEDLELESRRAATMQLGKINTKMAEVILKQLLSSNDKHLRRTASSSFLSLRQLDSSKKIQIEELVALLKRESVDDQVIWQAQAELAKRDPGEATAARLQEDLKASQERRRRHMFRLLSLCFDVESLHASFRALTGKHNQARDNALEYLDNILPEKVKAMVWPLIDPDANYQKKSSPRETDELVQDLRDVGATGIIQMPMILEGSDPDTDDIFSSSDGQTDS
jgi:ATP/ADP translocase